MTFPPLEGVRKLKSGSDEVSFSTVSCSLSVLPDGRAGHLARQANNADGGLKIPAVCLNGHRKGKHILNIFFSFISRESPLQYQISNGSPQKDNFPKTVFRFDEFKIFCYRNSN